MLHAITDNIRIYRRYLGAVALWVLSSTLFGAEPLWSGYRPQNDDAMPTLSAPIEPAVSTETRFYLLRTGFLMEGTAVPEDKSYVIKTDYGSMHVPMTNVEFVGKNKGDVYRYKRSFVDGSNCNELMKFAEWCLNIGLKSEGIAEYERALAAAPNSVLAEVIRVRLEETRRLLASPDAPEDEDAPNQSLFGSAPRLKSRNESDVTRWVSGIPKSVVDQYVKNVQPILLSSCASADCHGTNSENPLKIAKPRQVMGATTYGNLRAVLPWVNLDYPSESPLLSALVSPHGGAKSPYTVESKQYDHVVRWIQLAAKELPIELHQRLVEERGEPKKVEASAASQGEPLRAKKDTLLPPGFDQIAPPPDGVILQTAAEEKPDPLDPEIFNARHHGTTRK